MSAPRRTSGVLLLVAALVVSLGALLSPSQAATGVPSVPLNVVAKVGAGRTVTVTWSTPADGGTSPLKGYVITPSDPDVDPVDVPVNAARSKKFDLSGYPVSTGISFTVAAYNAVGQGPASAPTTPITIPATAPDAPKSVKVTQDTSLDDPLVSWTLGSIGGSAITSSTITVQPGDIVLTVDGDATEATVPGLEPGTKYTFAVVVSNDVGNSKPTYAAAFTPWSAPEPVTNLRGTRGYQSAKLTWTRSVTHGKAVSKYQITVMPGGGTFTVPGSNTSATLTGLHNGTHYTAEVTPVIGDEVFDSTTSPAFVPAGNPGPPYVLAVRAGKGKVVVRWAAAFTNGEAIRRYVLHTSKGVFIRDIGPNVRSFTVGHLRRGTKIRFQMRSVNSYGPSPWGAWTQTVTVR